MGVAEVGARGAVVVASGEVAGVLSGGGLLAHTSSGFFPPHGSMDFGHRSLTFAGREVVGNRIVRRYVGCMSWSEMIFNTEGVALLGHRGDPHKTWLWGTYTFRGRYGMHCENGTNGLA